MRRHLLLLAFLLAALPLAAATQYSAGAGSRLRLEGSSNIAPWRCNGTTVDGQMEMAARLDVQDFRLVVPVSSLRCGNRQMERDLVRALRANEHPSIDFRFTEVLERVERHGRWYATIAGELALAGERRSVKVLVEAQNDGNELRMQARLALRMTDFGITPPTALFGMIHANDNLVVRFDLVLQKVQNTHSVRAGRVSP